MFLNVRKDDRYLIFLLLLFYYLLGRTLAQLEDDIAPCEAQMENWKTNLTIMDSKERQYFQQYSNYKVIPFCFKHYLEIKGLIFPTISGLIYPIFC